MSIVSRRTVGQILLAYDDGASPPTDPTPLGSIVSVADGTLWVSLGGGSYTQASGGGPLGDSTVWSSRIDWADLGTLPSGDIRSGDLAPISDLGGLSLSYGTAIYNGGWALFSGYFQDPADLLAFTQPINTGAVVSVGAANEDGIRYYYDSAQWVRTPDATGYFWQAVPDWPTLLTTYPADNLRSGDFCLALSLDTAYGAAYGIAVRDSGTWNLFLGVFETVADMNAFAIAYPVNLGALASVYPGAVDSGLSVRFFWDGLQWVRAPDGIHYVWGQVPNWAALSTIIAPKNNDEVPVNTLGTSHSSGTAQRHGGSSWRLLDGKFETVTDLNTFTAIPRDIASGAVALIKAGGGHDEESAAYKYISSTWYRLPDGVGYIHPTVGLWANLTSAIDTPIAGDICRVSNLGYTNSTGTARYSGSQWELSVGYFATTTDRDNFLSTRPIVVGATIFIGPIATYFDSLSYRQVGGVPFTYTLSSLDDFSGVGLQDGDYGVLTQSGGDPVVVRYKAACPTAYASPIPAWISPEAYSATPVIQGYLIGSEDASARAAQGWTDVLSAAGTRSITGNEGGSGETRLLGEHSGGQPGLAQLACGVSAMLAGTKVWWSAVIRGSTTGTVSEAGVRFAGDGTNANWIQQRTVSGTLRMTDGSNTPVDSNQIPGGAGSALPGVASTPDLFVGFDTGSTGVSRVSRKGSAYSAARRPAGLSVQNNALRFSAVGGASSSQGVLRVSYVIVVTY